MHDSGDRQEFDTGCVRDAAVGKCRPDLVSPLAMMRLGDWLGKGAEKYAERNWEMGMPISRCVASLERHLVKWKAGMQDEDHLAAIMCNAMFIVHYDECIKQGWLPSALDDMPYYTRTTKGGVDE